MSANNTNQPEPITLALAEVVQAYRVMRSIETTLAEHKMSAFPLALLAFFAASPSARMRDAARFLGVSSAVVTGGIDRLEKRGFVTRLISFEEGRPDGRREITVHLSERGREMLATLAEIRIEGLPDLPNGAAS